MRGIRGVNERGEVVWRVGSMKEAAAVLGVSVNSIFKGIRYGTVRKGVRAEYDDDQQPATARKRQVVCVNKSMRGKGYKVDDMTDAEMDREVREYEAQGIHLERVRYELKAGVITVSPCMRLDWKKRVKVGSMGCVTCSHFRGKSRKRQEVLCIHRSRMLKEGQMERGRKVGFKANKV